MRVFAVVLPFLVAALAAAEPTDPPAPVPAGTIPTAVVPDEASAPTPALLTVEARGGGVFSLLESEPNELLDGVRIGYAGALLRNDRIRHWQSTPKGLTRAILDHAVLLTGPHGEDPAHVIIDTRLCELPQLGFRGLLTPDGVEVQRIDIEMLPPVAVGSLPKVPGASTTEPITDPAHSGNGKKKASEPPIALVHYRILLHHLEDFQGKLHGTSGWKDYAGWADEAELLMVADLLPAGLANPRFETIHLFGRQARDGEPKRPSRLVRLRQDVSAPKRVQFIKEDQLDFSVESMTQTIEFDALGQVKHMRQGLDAKFIGIPSLDMPVVRSSQPQLEPVPAKPKP